MIVQIFQVTGAHSRSVMAATLIAEVYVDEIPDDQIEFAEQHGGDFIEVIGDYDSRRNGFPTFNRRKDSNHPGSAVSLRDSAVGASELQVR